MKEIMQNAQDIIMILPTWVIVLGCILLFVGVVGQWALYEKCGLPGYSCLVPVWNVITFLKIVGRPAKHCYMVIVPPIIMAAAILITPNLWVGIAIAGVAFLPWAYFMIKIYVEVCQSFGKKDMMSYILIVLFNGFYLFNLALSQEEKYYGPIYKEGTPEPSFI